MTANPTRACSLTTAFLGVALCCGSVMAASVTLHIPRATASAGATAEVPLMVTSAEGLGALQLAVTYDPSVVELTAAEPGALLSGLVDWNVVTPGLARIAMATNQAINGDGEVVVMSFSVLGGTETTLGLEEVRAWEEATGFEMMVSVEPGGLVVGGGYLIPIVAGVALAALLALVWLVRRGRRKGTV